MTKRLLLFLALAAACGPLGGADPEPADASAPAPGWFMVWNDEFDGPTVDPANWKVENAALIKNNEKQYYAPDEVYLQDGCLVLRSRKRTVGDRDYTSGLVETRHRFAPTYGRFEVRAKLPRGKGMWPAHWMLPDDGTWPPEIDIMELVGHIPNVVVMSVHGGTRGNKQYDGKDFFGPYFAKEFHTFALEWEPGELRWFIDGVQRFKTQKLVPKVPMFIILNTAVGGDWPGNPDKTTVFPQYHLIDYVRAYAREQPGTCLLNVSGLGGRVSREPAIDRYPQNSAVKLTAIPSIGHQFARWSGDASGQSNPLEVTLHANKTIRAEFVRDPDPPRLLSRGKAVATSSQENSSLAGGNAVDGDVLTRWSSAFHDPQWLAVDLGKPCKIEAIRIQWERAHGREYEIQVSDDAEEWKKIHYQPEGKGDIEEITGLDVRARYVRYHGTARNTQYGHSMYEFEVLGR